MKYKPMPITSQSVEMLLQKLWNLVMADKTPKKYAAPMMEAYDTIMHHQNRQAWRDPKTHPPKDPDKAVLVIVSGTPRKNLELHNAYEVGFYDENCGWIIDAYPEWESAQVKCWKNLPAAPEWMEADR